ncbi:AbrB/MazE/SpoVT family DNA-binding domain-containing protein [Enterococcus sp. UD-01]|jgi:hypothetical membrane protein|uniref:AbrB/MazE/SpoVT family DNA-binding domain-containing protein n=1 Tax=Enterococcus sp. UD-01 TaxID=3373911 RepID=UPI00383945DD
MSHEKNKISLPPAVVEQLELKTDTKLQLSLSGQKMIIEPLQQKTETQTVSLRWFLIPSIISSLIFIAYFHLNDYSQIMMTGSKSIASMVILLGLLSGMCSFIVFFIQAKKKKITNLKAIYWRNLPTILLSFTVILGVLLVGFFWLVGIVFEGASFDLLTATLIFFLFTSLVNYLMIYFALAISPALITTLLISMIVGGVLLAMATNSQLQWWQKNFSFLGTNEAKDSWQFNLTLMISALLMIALVDYLFVLLHHLYPKNLRLTLLRIFLTLTALDLGAVGFFPNNGHSRMHELHNQAANLLVYMIILLIVAIKWLLPKVTKEFLSISYLIGAILFVANLLFSAVGYLSLTAFELIAFFLAFSWILLLLQHLQKLAANTGTVYPVTLE